MNDFYTEQLVKKRKDGKDVLVNIILVILTLLSVWAVMMMPLLIILPILMVAADIFILHRMDVEYEYIYINGDLDIDKVMHKEKRKHLFSVNINDMELLAPEGSREIADYKVSKVLNYCGNTTDLSHYALIAKQSGQLVKVLFEPNESLIEGVYLLAPRKVIQRKNA